MPWGAISPYSFWSQVPLASRTVTVTTNNDKTGYTASTVSDKTGYSLTAGSYSVRASSAQRGTGTISSSATGSITISSVTTTRASAYHAGFNAGGLHDNDEMFPYMQITGATTVSLTRNINHADTTTAAVEVAEFF